MNALWTRRRQSDESEDSAWISLSDLMTSLFMVFMLIAVALVLSLSTEQASLRKMQAEAEEARAQAQAAQERGDRFDAMLSGLGETEQHRAELVRGVYEELQARGVQAEIDASASVLRIPVDSLGFDPGEYEIKPEHRAQALLIGQTIADSLLQNDRYQELDTVFIEGHTDNIPMNEAIYGGNWGLSTNRAISLWRLWETDLPTDLAALRGATGEPLISVSGYADTRPVVPDQNDDASRSMNRRIDIRFTEHRLSEEDIAEIWDGAQTEDD